MSKTAIITGAGGYIGSATAKELASQGINIAVCDINEATLQKTVDAIIEAGGSAKGYVIDVTNSADVDRVVNEVKNDFGTVDISIHIAGGSARIAGDKASYGHVTEKTDECFDIVMKVNLYGAFYLSRAAARIMKEQGTGGKIINFSSIVGLNGLKGSCDYAAAKAGVMGLTKVMAKELSPFGINVNSVAPGVVARPEATDPHYIYETNLLGQKCEATDIADLVSFLVSDKAKFITGQTYIIDGGRSLSMKGSD